MPKCHGCFNMLAYCTCANAQTFLDPENGLLLTRLEFDEFLNGPPKGIEEAPVRGYDPDDPPRFSLDPGWTPPNQPRVSLLLYLGPPEGFEDWAHYMVHQINEDLGEDGTCDGSW